MEKFTREYAEKVARRMKRKDHTTHTSEQRELIAKGYMKAIEETNAPELLEALKIISELGNTGEDAREMKLIAINAINKATL